MGIISKFNRLPREALPTHTIRTAVKILANFYLVAEDLMILSSRPNGVQGMIHLFELRRVIITKEKTHDPGIVR